MRKVFGNHTEMDLPIPRVIDDYNYHMNRVDRANQLRAWMYCGRPYQRRWWRPIWYWLLDTCSCNAYLIWKAKWDRPDTGRRLHRKFHEALIEQLWAVPRTSHTTLAVPGVSHATMGGPTLPRDARRHIWGHFGRRRWCVWCKKHKEGWVPKRAPNRIVLGEIRNQVVPYRGSKTWGGCIVCQEALCMKGSCFRQYHSELGQHSAS